MRNVAIGLLGSTLDRPAKRGDRWESWRPTVGICQQPELPLARLELLYDPRGESLLDQLRADIASVAPSTTVEPHPIDLNDPWDFEEVFAALHNFASNYSFDTEREDYFVHITTGTHVEQICLFLLAESRHFPAKLLQSSPIRADRKSRRRNPSLAAGQCRTIDLDLSRYDKLAARFNEERLEGLEFLKSGIATRNANFNQLIEHIERVAISSDAPILLTGPTGAGKTHLAKRIYELKQNRQLVGGQFMEVNCATIRGEQAHSTLFGHKKGAFTGANSDRDGLLKAANGGMLFLDEIGELGLDEQAMLLRAVEDKQFLPLGSDKPITSDFQLLAGTNRDLRCEVAEGNFREDLLARINLWTFRLPGLAERRDDIEPNVEFELARYANATGRKVTMNAEARKAFLKFSKDPSSAWSGNFRDLNAAITRMATLARNGRISQADVVEESTRLKNAWHRPSYVGEQITSEKSEQLAAFELEKYLTESRIKEIDLFDQPQLAMVLRVCSESKTLSEAGRKLFQASRTQKQEKNDSDRLRKYLAKFKLAWSDIHAAS